MALKERRFDTRESIIADSKKVLKNIPEDAFSKCFKSWEKRWKLCIDALNYIINQCCCRAVLPQYRAVAGQTAELPCNLSVPTRIPVQAGVEVGPPDAVSLVLWYRGEAGAPIYIVDARRHKTPRHFPGPERGRLDFDMARGVLRMSAVSREDEGEYRCRVDYRYARTAVSALYLHVVGKDKETKHPTLQGGVTIPSQVKTCIGERMTV
ncbi:hypothetical protein LAZ67_8000863 [Cordylochernes scorpioides]|uniref:Ig-like domain-containing protein n=1 Tax=Cordylochernes scorpioides TaxID=51811 RepID=A0ABY6KQA6_9ARAC|nr:hypothetical protein LAZ67_8000863 [Cordylochernes scorpioides]